MSDKRAVCLNCMDGRAQLPVIEWVKKNCDVEFVDMITEAGMDGFLTKPLRIKDLSEVLANCEPVESRRKAS